jgi:hypothetical protein
LKAAGKEKSLDTMNEIENGIKFMTMRPHDVGSMVNKEHVTKLGVAAFASCLRSNKVKGLMCCETLAAAGGEGRATAAY